MSQFILPALIATLAANSLWAEGKRLPSLPDKEGFAAPFAGISHGALLVGGGANFPDKRPWQGGAKKWYDSVFVLERPDGEWKHAGRLPRPLAYGISATRGDAVICAGGSDADRHYPDVFSLEWKNGELVTTGLPSLPKPIANACGVVLGDNLYILGGQENPDSVAALKTVFALDLAASAPKWREIESWPGAGRILATAAAFNGSIWIAGGANLFEGKDGKSARQYLKDAYQFDPKTGWKCSADLPCSIVAAPSPAPIDANGFYLLGGDDGTHVGFDPPDKHPGFRKHVLRYDAMADRWLAHGEIPAAHVTVPLVRWLDAWVMPSGEIRPGVRTPEVWSITLDEKR